MKTKFTLPFLLALMLFNSATLIAQEFINDLQIPPLIVYNNQGSYDLDVIATTHNFSPMGSDSLNTMVPTFAFEDFNNPGKTTILGPTISWQFGDNLAPTVLNRLDEVTTTHWHGAHVPQSADGGPHQRIQPDSIWEPEFVVKDKSATMWYHPHAMGLTYRQVQMGLSGMIYVEDPVGTDPLLGQIHEILPTEYKVNDFPLIFQTKKFKRDAATNAIVIQADDGYKDDYTYMVNGIVDPVLDAPANMIRLRILNGDGKFSYNFEIIDENNNPVMFNLIATDAGYMTRSYGMSSILMAPGERTEWLLDLRGRDGEVFYIRNKVSGIPDGVIGNSSTTDGYAVDRNLLKMVVGPSSGPPSPIVSFPISLYPSEQPPMSEVSKTRVKTFRKDMFDVSTKPLFNIDSTLMDMMVVNDVVRLDSTEIWTIKNITDIAHPWHIHDIHFWVTEILENGVPLNKDDYPQLFDGPKDNVLVMPGWELSYIATFADYGTEIMPNNSYMYHCHILPHEDNGMMGQFVVWNGEGNPNTSTEDPELSDRSMTLYPNPTQGALYLQGASEEKSIIRIFDLQGRMLSQLTVPRFDGNVGFDVSALPKGMVVLEWLSKEGKAVSKVVIE